MKSLGKRLEEARIAKGWTPEAAAKATKIKVERLLEIERDDYSRFPAATYVRGFVRVYARELGLDENVLASELDELCDHEDGESYVPVAPVEYVPQEMKYPRTVSVRRVGTYIIVFVLVLMGFSFVKKMYQVWNDGISEGMRSALVANKPAVTPSAGTPSVPKATPVKPEANVKPGTSDDVPVARAVPAAEGVGPTPPVAVEAPTQHRLKVKVTDKCWVRITSLEGSEPKVLFEDELAAGAETEVYTSTQFQLNANPGSAVRVYYDDYKDESLTDKAGPHEVLIPRKH